MPIMFFRNSSPSSSHPCKHGAPLVRAPLLSPSSAVDVQTIAPAKSGLPRWFARVGAAMDRAEQRITDSFKVPPSGG
ncbi:MAG: hypothetical protein ACK41V_05065 [Acidovorax sp.]|uniref:hypothetical protein n=1 Tax=Acidovorax sp. TaxID=1872122 RepID=UPI00391C1D2D